MAFETDDDYMEARTKFEDTVHLLLENGEDPEDLKKFIDDAYVGNT